MPTRGAVPRRGFTLLELMLVLAIIGMLGALSVPAFLGILDRHRLRGAAQNLRLEWDSARLEAMRTGQTQVFQCVPGTGDYAIVPLVLQSDVTNAGDGATVMTGGGALVETHAEGFMTAADPSLTQTRKLEAPIVFVSCAVVGDMRALTVAQESQSAGAGDLSTQTANQAVLFYPDGSTSTAEVRIQSEQGDMRAVQLRGLTGHSRVVELPADTSGATADGATAGTSDTGSQGAAP